MGLTAVAVSGGVDSLVAAYLLKKKGPVVGVHFKTGYHPVADEDIHRIGEQLGIPVHILDVQTAFKERVVDYFVETYRSGRTPNPCLVCNPAIKFGRVFDIARSLEADRLATGHYARIRPGADGSPRLYRGRDPQKEQSYFLAFLTPAQLAAADFPLGDMTKPAVKALAAEKGLRPVSASESQDICFIRKSSYGGFIAGHQKTAPRPGPILDLHGRHLGEHKGLHLYTVGQRRGIDCPAGAPYYVVSIEPHHNRLIVGFKEDLLSPECWVTGVNWIGPEPAGPVAAAVRIRYRHRAAPARLHPEGGGRVRIAFHTPQSAVTPGQGAVFYQGEAVLGAGWIEPGRDQE
jgi:tRNA-specific 2-thiouridylase